MPVGEGARARTLGRSVDIPLPRRRRGSAPGKTSVRQSEGGSQECLGEPVAQAGPGRGWEWSCQGLPPPNYLSGVYSWYLEDLQHVSIL